MNRIETNSPGGAPQSTEGMIGDPGASAQDRSDPRLARIARLAARVFSAPLAAAAVVEGGKLVTRATVGGGHGGWLRPGSLCDQARSLGEPVLVGDLRQHPRLEGAAGGLRFCAAAPLIAEGGQVIGLLCVADTEPRSGLGEAERTALVDLATLATHEIGYDAEASAAREQSRLDQERANLALSAAGLAGYEWDLVSDSVAISAAARALIGWSEAAGRTIDRPSLRSIIHPDDQEATIAQARVSLGETGRYQLEFRVIRPDDGRIMWVSSAGALAIAGLERPHRVIGVIQDITARKTEEEERETLVAELDHRVKNVLAAVQSLAAQSARKAASLDGFLKTFAGRLKSMASAHQLLTATRWRGAGMHNIAAAELGGLAPGQTRWSGPDVLLTPRGANAMSLALHELATNAVKFGSLSTEVGRVEVTWRRTEDLGLELQWLESHGPAVRTPTRRGFGTTLLEKVTGRELGGAVRVEYRAEGVRALLTVGASAFAPAAGAGAGPPREAAAASLVGPQASAPAARQAIEVTGLRLLIVEDALLLALELEAGLTEAGAEVLGAAADVGEAMRMVDLPIDAAVLDANLNGASVAPVARALTERGIPFVFATGYGDDKMLPAGFDAPVIRKPYDVTQVAGALSEVTGRVARG